MSENKGLPWAVIWALVLVSVLPIRAFAGNYYQPDAQVKLMIEMTAQDIPGIQAPFTLTVSSARTCEDTIFVDFSSPANKAIKGSLEFSQDGHIAWNGASIVRQLSADSLLLVPGLSIPVDILPVNRMLEGEEPEFFSFEKQAGTRTFIDRFRISIRPINLEEAITAQWIKVKDSLPLVLYMIEATDAVTNRLVVRQLWAPDTDWWLYEQTPFRQSWQIH